jgi:hypothetical protein
MLRQVFFFVLKEKETTATEATKYSPNRVDVF